MDPRDFETCVADYYADLYRFAYSLAKNESDACDFTQQAFAIFAQKGGEIRDSAKRKHWLFTTLYREFLKGTARAKRHLTMEERDLEAYSPPADSDAMRTAEHHEILEALASLEETPRAILSLFYLDDCSYKEIAEILDMPIGTVMSRLSRAKEALRQRWQEGCGKPE